MKNICLLMISIFLLTSCDVTEKIYFNEDESVKYSLESDLSVLTKIDPEKNKKDLGDNYPIDTIMTFDEFREWDIQKENGKMSNFDNEKFSEIFKDFKIQAVMNDSASKMALFTKQNSVKKLNKVLSKVYQKSQGIQDEEGNDMDDINNLMFGYLFQKHHFDFKGNKFIRKSNLNTNSFKKIIEMDDKGMGLSAFLILTNYNTEYHFPKPVKFVSDTTVKLSWDRKTIYIENNINDLIDDSKALNLVIELEE